MTFFQSTSNSSATIMGMAVFTFCPISGLGDMMVTRPLSAIFRNPLISNHSLGRLFTSSGVILQEASQLNPIIMPPPASADDLIKERLPILVFTSVIFFVFRVLWFYAFCVAAAAVLMAFLMRTYVPHLQIFPFMAASISSSLGEGFLFKSAVALMICPAWQ